MLFQDLGWLALLLGSVVAEVPDPEEDLITIADAQSVVVGGYFYIMGGYEEFRVPDGFPFGDKVEGVTSVGSANDHLRRIDLTRPFTVSKIDTVQEQSIPLSDEVPRMRFGTMWAHNTTIYLGPSELEIYPLLRNGTWTNETRRAPTKGIWTYDTANPDAGWAKLTDLGYNDTFNPVTRGSVAYLDGIAYVMGGTYSQGKLRYPNGTYVARGYAGEQEVRLDSLFKLDVERKVATNETSSIGHVRSGRMVSIKGVGQKGILVYIGGLGSNGYNDMSIIQVYDIASSTWKSQKATAKDGDSPRRRKGFCAVVMSAQDHSSHQIYFYGGNPSDSTTGPILDDVWVLTLPSFQFIKVSNSAEAARASGTCAVVSPQYLLAYRGESYVGSDGVNLLGDASLALLDLTSLEWKTEYTPANTSTVYRVPRKVLEVIGGDETGRAAATAPKGGFDDQSLAAVFNLSDSKRPTSSSVSSSSSLQRRKVIGVSIGSAVLAILCIAGTILLFRHRQRNKLRALAMESGPKFYERGEVEGNMVVPVNYELEGSRPVVCEIGSA